MADFYIYNLENYCKGDIFHGPELWSDALKVRKKLINFTY